MILYGKEKEILRAQKRSLAAWINNTLGATLVDADNLISKLSTGVILCKLAKCIQKKVDESCYSLEMNERPFLHLRPWERAKRETFFARDNAEMFIRWCKSLGVRDAVLFESDGLVMQTQPRTVLLCLMELARLASRYGVLLPPPVQLPPTTLALEEASDGSEEDEFLFAATLPSKSGGRRDSGCSSGERSPDAGSVFSKTSSPISSLRKKGGDKSVVVLVRSRSDNFVESARSSSPRVSGQRNSALARTDTISSRLRCDATLSRSNSSIVSSKSSLQKSCNRGSTRSLPSYPQQKKSPLDKRVSELARQYLKDEHRYQRLSEGHYSFGDKIVYLRIVRGNNVVVRIGGGWDTLEHYLSVLHFDRTRPAKKSGNQARRPAKKVPPRVLLR